MAKAKTIAPAPAPINTYGIVNPNLRTQFHYDVGAYLLRLPFEKTGMTRLQLFRSISDRLTPNFFQWHDWTIRQIEHVIENRWIGLAGCSGCVSGDTRILDPITGHQPTIQHLYENGIAPIVMTLDGPIRACVPYIKGIDELYRITLENGSQFCATGKHRVLTSDGDYSYVEQLQLGAGILAYESHPQESISGISPSTPLRDDLHYEQTIEDSQVCCRRDYHSSDGKLRSEEGNGQELFPSQAYAQTHIRPHSCSDGLVSRFEHILSSLQTGLRSILRFLDLSWNARTPCQNLVSSTTGGLSLDQSRQFLQETQVLPHHWPFAKSSPCEPHSEKHSRLVSGHSYPYRYTCTTIKSIRPLGKNVYYDISVPGPQHYFAEGCIHHNSAKSHNIGGFAVNWWLMAPEESAVIVCSTSLKAMKRRIWSNIQAAYQAYPKPRFGNFVDSKLTWQATYGDEKHAIIGVAVEEGEVTKAADKIKGHHTKRLLVIIDEATAIPPAIFDAISNLWSYPCQQKYGEFIMVVIGNPRSKFDQMGLFCQPKNGWNSVSLEDEEWETVPKLDNRTGICIRFDALKSPNITKGRIVSQHLPTKEMVDAAMSKAGSANDPAFWSNWRGYWPPDDITNSVFSILMLEAGKATSPEKFQFTGRNMQTFCGFDPAFGGADIPAVRFVKTGELVTGGIGLQLMEPMRVKLDASSTIPIQYQLAYGIKALCEKHGCPPRNLNVDRSANAGVFDILRREWSREIMGTQFGELASESILDNHDGKTAKQLYKNRAAEIWFDARDYVMTGQLRGLDQETSVELCGRWYEGGTDNSKIALEPKSEYRLRNSGKSPDNADALCLCLNAARMRGIKVQQAPTAVLVTKEFEKEVEQAQHVWGEPTHESEDIEEMEEALV